MATSYVGMSADEVKDAYGLWYKPGDYFIVETGYAAYAGFLRNSTLARIVIPISKPVKPGTAAKLIAQNGGDGGGKISIRTGNARTNLTGLNVDATYITDCGIAFDISSGSTSMGSTDDICVAGSAGFRIVFFTPS